MSLRLLAAAVGLIVSASVPLAIAQNSALQVDKVWSRAAMAGRTGVVFLTIRDQGGPDRLIGVTSPVADSATLHESLMDQGVMKMRPMASIPVTAEAPAVLAPNGYHIMLTHLRQPLVAGQQFPVTLTFEKAGAVTVMATVAKAGAPGPMRDTGGASSMPEHRH